MVSMDRQQRRRSGNSIRPLRPSCQNLLGQWRAAIRTMADFDSVDRGARFANKLTEGGLDHQFDAFLSRHPFLRTSVRQKRDPESKSNQNSFPNFSQEVLLDFQIKV